MKKNNNLTIQPSVMAISFNYYNYKFGMTDGCKCYDTHEPQSHLCYGKEASQRRALDLQTLCHDSWEQNTMHGC